MSRNYGTIESQTKTARKLDKAFKQAAEEEMGGSNKGASHDGKVVVDPKLKTAKDTRGKKKGRKK